MYEAYNLLLYTVSLLRHANVAEVQYHGSLVAGSAHTSQNSPKPLDFHAPLRKQPG
jgi:hypothetical protein